MRVTLDIDHVLRAAEELGKARASTAGRVISALVRQQFKRVGGMLLTRRNGFWVLPRSGGEVTCELVRQLAEDDV
jgi:hypothetical protein